MNDNHPHKSKISQKIFWGLISALFATVVLATGNHSEEKIKIILDLPVAKQIDSQLLEPVEYGTPVIGEFIDVDLPDEEKLARYGTLTPANHQQPLQDAMQHDVSYSIQVGMYAVKENAERCRNSLLQQGLPEVSIQQRQNDFGEARYEVRYGRFINRLVAERELHNFTQTGLSSAFIITL